MKKDKPKFVPSFLSKVVIKRKTRVETEYIRPLVMLVRGELDELDKIDSNSQDIWKDYLREKKGE